MVVKNFSIKNVKGMNTAGVRSMTKSIKAVHERFKFGSDLL
jgi:hypothetical protein